MSGLREKKKKEAREKILKAGRILFLENGFDHTTTDQIAEMAEVSVGTIYNHYRTKEEIFIDSLFGSFNGSNKKDELIIPEGSEISIDFLLNYIRQYTTQLSQFGKPLLKELMIAGFNSSNNGSSLLEHLMTLDWKMMENIIGIISAIERDSEKNMLESKGEIVFSILAFEFMRFIYEYDYEIEELFRKMENKLRILFND